MKKLLTAFLALLLVLYAVGYFMDGAFQVTRSRVLRADRALVHSLVSDLHTWPDWTAWSSARDPECVWTYSGAESGLGAQNAWEGPELSEGRMLITASSLGGGIEFDLYWGAATVPTRGAIRYADVEDGLQVTWSMDGELEGSVGHWMTFMMDRIAGPDLERGLEGLAKKTELSRVAWN